MNTKNLSSICFAVALITMLACTTLSALADTGNDSGVSVTVAPVAKTLSLGEPVLVNYTITNANQNDAYVDLRDGINTRQDNSEIGWVTFTLTGADGSLVPAPSRIPAASAGAFSMGPRISPGSSYSGVVVASQWFSVTQPGVYTLTVHIKLPCTLGTGLSQSWVPVVQTLSFPLTITATNPNQLTSMAQSLSKDFFTSASSDARLVLLRELLSMPEATALPTLQTMVTDTKMTRNFGNDLVEEMSHLDSITSINILAQMCWPINTQEDITTQQIARSALARFAYEGSTASSKRVDALFDAHGEPIPEMGPLRLD